MLPEPIKKNFILIFVITYSIFLILELGIFEPKPDKIPVALQPVPQKIQEVPKITQIAVKSQEKSVVAEKPVDNEQVEPQPAAEIQSKELPRDKIEVLKKVVPVTKSNSEAAKSPIVQLISPKAAPVDTKDMLATAYSYTKIGDEMYDDEDYEKALEFYFKAILAHKKVSGKENKKTADLYNSIGLTYFGINNFDKALEYFKKALAVKEKILEKNNPSIGTTYNNIGQVYQQKHDYKKAIEYFSRDLLICESGLGAEHPLTKQVRQNIEQLKATAGGG